MLKLDKILDSFHVFVIYICIVSYFLISSTGYNLSGISCFFHPLHSYGQENGLGHNLTVMSAF